MAASISAVAAIWARAPSSTQAQKKPAGRGIVSPLATKTMPRKTSAKGRPNRKRTWVAPAVPSDLVSDRCVALRTVWLAAAITVNSAQSQSVSGIPTYPIAVVPAKAGIQ
jgi:hypothetical protein